MGRSVQVQVLDDLDGSPADETLKFSIDGVAYEIDLNAANADRFRTEIARYIVAGRRAARTTPASSPRSGGRVTGRPQAGRSQNQAIREWAKSRGYDVGGRGRIPSAIIAEFHETAR